MESYTGKFEWLKNYLEKLHFCLIIGDFLNFSCFFTIGVGRKPYVLRMIDKF